MANLADVIVSDSSDSDFAGNSESARKALTEAVTAPQETVQETTQETKQEDDGLPAKFKGKSAREIVDMYQNLESRAGSMANELGVQRQLTDRLLGLKREDDLRANDPGRKQKVAPQPVTTNDLLDRPQETLDRVVTDRVASVQDEVNQRIQRLEGLMTRQAFENKHRDYQQTVGDPAFIEWIKASPLRMRAANVANAGDWVVADELFTEYEAQKRSSGSTTQQNRQDESNLDEARKASFTTGGNASGTDGKPKPGKVFKRSDLMRLRIEDPEAYYDEAFQNEILRAHAEGRVR